MEGCNKLKPKKKEGLDRIKQAEKKKRRIEKALATSAAIRIELEKKKEKKKEEEEQRLDDEGAAIAEAVALHVLLEDDESNKNKCRDNLGMFTYNGASNHEYDGYGSYPEWSDREAHRCPRYMGEECWWLDDVVEAVSSLRITDEDRNMYY